MRSLSITDDQLIENIASIHEYYLEKSGLIIMLQRSL